MRRHKGVAFITLLRRILIVITIAFGLMTIIATRPFNGGHGGRHGTTVRFGFPLDGAEYFAWQDGDGPWQEVATHKNDDVTINVTDSDGRYGAVLYGNYRSKMKGYLVYGTTDELSSFSFRFDNTADTTTYTLNGNADNFSTGYFYAGTHFRSFSNRLDITPGAFTYDHLVQDEDDPTTGDVLFRLLNAGLYHYKKMMVDYTLGASIDYTADPADSGKTFAVDHSAVRTSTGYEGISLKFSGVNLKAQLYTDVNTGNDVETLDKFSVSANDLFTTGFSWTYNEPAFTETVRYSVYYNDPLNVTIPAVPVRSPDIVVDSDADWTIKFDIGVKYLNNLGLNDQFRIARTSNGSVDWQIYQTWGRYGDGMQMVGFPSEITMAPGFPAGMEPVPADAISLTHLASNRDIQTEWDFAASGQKPAAGYNGMMRLELSVRF